jgi:hypothetical protein
MSDELEPFDRSRGGMRTHLTPQEILAIRVDHLECDNISEVARRHGVKRETVARCLDAPEYQRLKEQHRTETNAVILGRLRRKAQYAADYWIKAIEAAAERGNHHPMEDLLLHLKVLEPITKPDAGPKVIVQVGVDASQVSLSSVVKTEP